MHINNTLKKYIHKADLNSSQIPKPRLRKMLIPWTGVVSIAMNSVTCCRLSKNTWRCQHPRRTPSASSAWRKHSQPTIDRGLKPWAMLFCFGCFTGGIYQGTRQGEMPDPVSGYGDAQVSPTGASLGRCFTSAQALNLSPLDLEPRR